MANIRKTFNFRNGVQVDEDNFIVDSLGKVGIGTTIPAQMIDCRGNAKVVGILTSQSLETRNVNIAGVTTFSGDTHVGVAITFYPASGIISATQLRGDGSNLINIPTSQWTDTDVGLGHTSIYNTGFVGVSTNDPRFTFQVGGNDDLTTFANGVGINSSGNIVATGVITATNFKGDLQGKVTGTVTGHLNGTTLNVSGISTFVGISTFNGEVGYSTHTSMGDKVSAFFGDSRDFSITHDGSHTYLDESGTGDLYIRSNRIFLGKHGTNETFITCIEDKGVSLRWDDNIKLSTRPEGILVTGISSAAQFTGKVNAGIATITSKLDLGSISTQGINTSTPQSNLHISQSGISSIHVGSASNESVITLGRGLPNESSSGGVRYGNTNTGFPYSTVDSLDFINYATGNVNFYLEGGATSSTPGNFYWHKRKNSARLMTLTSDGKLGIGVTTPVKNLHVVGTSTVTGDAEFGNDVLVLGTLTAGGAVITSGGIKANVIAPNNDVIVSTGPNKAGAMINANINSVGVSSIQSLEVNGTVGVRTDDQIDNLVLVQGPGVDDINGDFRFSVTDKGHIGVGIASALCTADFAGIGNTYRHYMRPPHLTNANRAVMQAEAESGALEGAMIYNTTINKMQFYNGTAWETITSST